MVAKPLEPAVHIVLIQTTLASVLTLRREEELLQVQVVALMRPLAAASVSKIRIVAEATLPEAMELMFP